MRMGIAACALAFVLGGCRFDGSGSVNGDPPAPDAAGAPDAAVAAPPDASIAHPSPDANGGGGFGCNFDQTCDAGDDPTWCPDCTGGWFVCNFDQTCDPGEDPNCLDCL